MTERNTASVSPIEFPDSPEGAHPEWAQPGPNMTLEAVGGAVLHVIRNGADVRHVLTARHPDRSELFSIIHGAEAAVAGVSFQQAGEIDGSGNIIQFGGGLQSDRRHGHLALKRPMMTAFGHTEIGKFEPKINDITQEHVQRLPKIMDQDQVFDLGNYIVPALLDITVAASGMSYEAVEKAFWHSANTTGSLVRTTEDLSRFREAWFGDEGQYALTKNVITEIIMAERSGRPSNTPLSKAISGLGRLTIGDRQIGPEEMKPEIATLINGFATTINPAIRGILRLARLPELIEAAREDPTLWTQIAYGTLKFDAFSNTVPRKNHSGHDITLPSGYVVPAGAVTLPSTLAATLESFDVPAGLEPEEARRREIEYILRSDHRTTAYGTGPHACTGQHLATASLAAMYKAIYDKYDLQLAIPYTEMGWRGGVVPYPDKPLVRALPRDQSNEDNEF